MISFESIDSATCICSSFFFYWNDFSSFFSFQWIKTRLINEAAAFCYRNRLNGNLYLTSIEGPVRMAYAIILFLPGAKKQNLSLKDFAKKTPLKMTIFSPRCSNFVYSFSQRSFLFLTIFFKQFEDRQFKLHALINFFWFLILTTVFNWGDQNYHEQ